jgi:sugar phosphate isomerase/epimerase
MRLSLSSAAAPDASFHELLEVCARRGLTGLELEVGHGHGLDVSPGWADRATVARDAAAATGIRIAGLRLSPADLEADPGDLAALSLSLGAPLLVPAAAVESAPRGITSGLVRVILPSGPAAIEAFDRLDRGVRPAARLALALDVDPTIGDGATFAAEVLDRSGGRLRHIRLNGSGPEAVMHEGRGIGALLARLALSGFDGTLALAPSSSRYSVIWSAWLGRRGGWGCGSKTADRELVALSGL